MSGRHTARMTGATAPRKRHLRLRFLEAAAAVICWAAPVSAQMPVTDVANTAQNIEQLARATAQLNELLQQGEALVRQVELMESELEALTAPSSFGGLANSEAHRRLRRLGDLGSTLESLTDGEARGPVTRLGRDHLGTYGLVSGEEVYAPGRGGEANPLGIAHDKSLQAVATGAGTTRAVLAGSERRTDTYEAFLEELDRTPTLKASTDLGTRVAIENGLLLNDLLRTLAVDVELEQTRLARELASDQAEANFFVRSADVGDGGSP